MNGNVCESVNVCAHVSVHENESESESEAGSGQERSERESSGGEREGWRQCHRTRDMPPY